MQSARRSAHARLIEELVDETLGLRPLEPLKHDPTVSDILINGPKCVYVERQGKLKRGPVQFRDLDHLVGNIQRDVELGATVDQALRRFELRSDYDGVRTLSSFVRESQKFGTQLTEALRLHADMLRLEREEAAEEKAQKAAVAILLPTLLLIFPAVFVVLVGPALIQI
jgi:Flp pilus assembly CpaF family ATPase